MNRFLNVGDIGDLHKALQEAMEIKNDRFKYVELGRNKTLLMVFFNSSLRTRLSTQKAALNLGMNVIVLDVNQGAWKLETECGVIMDGDKSEHLLEAIPVMGCYCTRIFLISLSGATVIWTLNLLNQLANFLNFLLFCFPSLSFLKTYLSEGLLNFSSNLPTFFPAIFYFFS